MTRRLGRGAAIALVAIVSVLALPGVADAVLSGTNGRIVFVSGRSGPAGNDSQAKVYLRTTIGSVGGGEASQAVTSEAGQYRHPTWSPDRRSIAYARNDGMGVFDVFTHNLETGAILRISNPANTSDRPAWSPDGTKIAFETTSGGDTDIIVYTIATGNTVNLTTGVFPNTLPATKPAWSPDSLLVYYTLGAPGGMAPGSDANILVEPANNLSSAVLAVPDSEIDEFQASISPDGSKICFTLGQGLNGTADVRVADLANPSAINYDLSDNVGTTPAHGDYNCTWSPDGQLVAYVRGTFTQGDLVMEPADDSLAAPHVLEDTASHFDGNPDWAPDGRPKCKPASAQTIRGGSVFVELRCKDRGPAYERTRVRESVRDQPTEGSVGPVEQGNPARVRYTAGSNFTGVDTFTFRGFDDFGFGPHTTATVEVLLPGRCANFQAGDAQPNTLVGSRFGDLIRGRGGGDVIRGLAGPDCLEGNGSRDRIAGGRGADLLEGGSGRNRLDGGAGNDEIRARNGRADRVLCGRGRRDVAEVDFEDTVRGCEVVRRS